MIKQLPRLTRFVTAGALAIGIAVFASAPLSIHAGGPISVTEDSITDSAMSFGYAPYSVQWYNQSSDAVTLKFDDGTNLSIPGNSQTSDKTFTKTTSYSVVGSNASSKITILSPLAKTSTKPTSVSLSWGSGSSVGVASYNVYRGEDGISGFQKLATITGTTYTDAGVKPSTSYSYYLELLDGSGTSLKISNYLDVVTPANQAPTAPTNLHASTTGNSAKLMWNQSTDDDGVSDYLVYSGTIQIGVAFTPEYTVQNLDPGKNYSYTVKARDKNNLVSASSNAVTVSIASVESTPTPSASPTTSPTPSPSLDPDAPTLTKITVDGQDFTPNPLNVLKVGLGKTISLAGTAKPNDTLTLSVYSQKKSVTIEADSKGNWSYDLDTTDLEAGSHRIAMAAVGEEETDLLQFDLSADIDSQAQTETTAKKSPLMIAAMVGIALALVGLIVSALAIFIPRYKAKKAAKLAAAGKLPIEKSEKTPREEQQPLDQSPEDSEEDQAE